MRTMILRCQECVPLNNMSPNEKSRTFRLLDNASQDDAALGYCVPWTCCPLPMCPDTVLHWGIWQDKLSWVMTWAIEHARNLVARWLSICKNWIIIGWACTKIVYSLADHARKLVTNWLCMSENWLLVGWACTKIGYSLAEHERKLVTRWLSMSENWLLFGWAWAKIDYSLAEHERKLVTL